MFLTLASATRIRMAVDGNALRTHSLSEQQTTERRKEILHGKESQEGRQESPEERQVARARSDI